MGEAYIARSDSGKTYLRNLWRSESDRLRETDVFDKFVKLERVNTVDYVELIEEISTIPPCNIALCGLCGKEVMVVFGVVTEVQKHSNGNLLYF